MSPVKYVVACPFPDNTVWKLALVPADKASQACLVQLRAFSESLCLARLRFILAVEGSTRQRAGQPQGHPSVEVTCSMQALYRSIRARFFERQI